MCEIFQVQIGGLPTRRCPPASTVCPLASGLWGWSSAQRAPLMMPSQCGALWHGRQGADFSVLSLIPNIYMITLSNSLEEEFGAQFKSEFWTIFKRKQLNIPMVETLFTTSTVPGLWGGGSRLIPECHIYLYFEVQNIIIFMLVFCRSTLYAFMFLLLVCEMTCKQTRNVGALGWHSHQLRCWARAMTFPVSDQEAVSYVQSPFLII